MGLASSNALTLPRINGLPPKLVRQKSTATTSNVAVSMIELGMANDDDAACADTPAVFVERVFERWVKEKTASLKLLSPCFTLTDSLHSLGEYGYEKDADQQIFVGVSYSFEDARYFSLKAKIEQLELTVPGLGQTALHNLYGWLAKSLLAITPDFIFNLVQYQYWGGEEDEKGFFDHDGAEDDCEENECPVTLAQFNEEFPPHVYSPGEIIKKRQLKELTKHKDPLVAQTAKLLLSQPDKKKWCEDNQEYVENLGTGNQCIGYNLMLDWDPAGSQIAGQVCDDWMEEVYNSGISTDLYLIFKSERNRDGIKTLFASLERYIHTLAWLERAVTLLATPKR